jgi:hypothetical protein
MTPPNAAAIAEQSGGKLYFASNAMIEFPMIHAAI